MSVVLLNESMVHYEVLGRGRPVIFLHGWVGSWRYWISSMQTASTSFRAYALDLWGFGGTTHQSHKPEMYSLQSQTRLVSSFLQEMGIGKIALVGHGWGALVALDFAAAYPDSVDRLMVSNCPLDIHSVDSRLFNEPLESLANSFVSSLPAGSDAALSEARSTDPAAIAASLNGVLAGDLFERVNRHHTPCLLVSGGQDTLIRAPSIDQLAQLSELGQHIILDESGHFPMLDSTGKFNRLLTDFLALDSGLSIRELGLKEEWKRRVR